MAGERFGIRGISSSFTGPIRAASREASRAEVPAKTFAPKKIPPSVARLHSESEIELVSGKALHDEAAEDVEREMTS